MSPEAGLIGFAGLTCLSLAMAKHRAKAGLATLPPAAGAKLAGWTLLALSLAVAVAQAGMGLGLVAWTGQLCVAGVGLVLLMSWRPGLAPPLAGVAMAFVPVLAWI